MSDVTISYAEADQDRASTIYKALQGAGYDVYWDADRPFGEERRHDLHMAMGDCKVCMILWSQAALDQHSDEVEGDVVHEAIWSTGEERHLSVLIDRVQIPEGYTPVDVAPFDGSEAQLNRIVDAVRNYIKENEQKASVAASGAPAIQITAVKNGPLKFAGDLGLLQLTDADGISHDLTGKKSIYLCRCGASMKKPFCDGQHSKIGFEAAEAAVASEA